MSNLLGKKRELEVSANKEQEKVIKKSYFQ